MLLLEKHMSFSNMMGGFFLDYDFLEAICVIFSFIFTNMSITRKVRPQFRFQARICRHHNLPKRCICIEKSAEGLIENPVRKFQPLLNKAKVAFFLAPQVGKLFSKIFIRLRKTILDCA